MRQQQQQLEQLEMPPLCSQLTQPQPQKQPLWRLQKQRQMKKKLA